uniref:Variant surface glycoprotein n=1 Tax=Trypanosoma brucei brucei TaxID=5702 RepID=B3GVN7_TRYBB|nr:variant surface glycoprotein [Trypanosoma brucei brucei]
MKARTFPIVMFILACPAQITDAQAAAKNPLDGSKIAGLCKKAGGMRQAAAAAGTALQAAEPIVQNAIKLQNQLIIYSLTAKHKQRAKIAAIGAAAAAKAINDIYSAAIAKAKAGIYLAAKANIVAGSIIEATTLLEQLKASNVGTNGACLTTAGKGKTAVDSSRDLKGCDNLTIPDAVNLEGVEEFSDTSFNSGIPEGNAASTEASFDKCLLFENHPSATGMFTGNTASHITLMAGLLTTTASGPSLRKIADLTPETPTSANTPAYLEAIKAANAYKTAADVTDNTVYESIYQELTADEFLAEINYAINGIKAKPEEVSATNELKAAARQILGDSATKFKSKFIKDMLEEELVFPTELKLTASTIQKIPTNRISEVVALLIQETISKATHDKKCPASHSASEKSTSEADVTCEKKGTGDNCKDGCKEVEEGGKKKCVKDPNYKPPQGEGGEKDSKTGTTNTTGSNSFTIKKAPLLLAVLFLA